MHEKSSKINFFSKIRKLQKKLTFAGKSLVGSRKSSRAVVKDVEMRSKSIIRKKISLPNAVTDCNKSAWALEFSAVVDLDTLKKHKF